MESTVSPGQQHHSVASFSKALARGDSLWDQHCHEQRRCIIFCSTQQITLMEGIMSSRITLDFKQH